jgi:hypothetical protein
MTDAETEQTAALLRDINKWIAARVAYLEGGRGLAMPEHVRDQAEKCESWLLELRTGERKLGRVSGGRTAALTQPMGVVDHDARATGVSMTALRRHGFR